MPGTEEPLPFASLMPATPDEGAYHRRSQEVVGSHGKGWVDRILLGSTTERLVTELPTSVLVVPVKAMASGRSRARPASRGAQARGKAPAA